MTVTLNIENDAELRAYIKEAVKSQVLSIVRDEFLQIVKDELERKIKGQDKLYFDRMIRDSMQNAVSSICYKEHNVASWRNDFINPIVSSLVSASLMHKDWDKLVDDVAKEKVKSLLK
jgi:hypothetical protein